jgi:hypothetical protein
MTAAATLKPRNCDPARSSQLHEIGLADSNINPQTGLATDYLNHFNEAIMLLEMVSETPECRGDFLSWQPKNYTEHFAASNFPHRDVAIAAYHATDPELRQGLDMLATSMNEILAATRQVMQQDISSSTAGAIADLAVRWIKPLIARAGAVINGTAEEHRGAEQEGTPQAAVDAVMAP